MPIARLRRCLVIGVLSLILCAVVSRFADAMQNSLANGYFGKPLPGLQAMLQSEFERGFQLFIKVWTPAEGLGTRINARSCAACHAVPLPGGSGLTASTLVPVSPRVGDVAGGHTFAQFVVYPGGGTSRRPLPPAAVMRKPPALFGLGVLEAVPVRSLLEYTDPNDRNGDGISGRLAKKGDVYGRFGWKGRFSSIEEAVAVALATDMGLSNTRYAADGRRAVEVSDENMRLIAQFVRLLAIPPSRPQDGASVEGQKLFESIGCGACHRASLRTSDTARAVPKGQVIHPYTDLLLHDMGPELRDGLQEGGASHREFRTTPLWGLASTGPPYLHDGRAKSLESAILLHGGEGTLAANQFKALKVEQRDALLTFLKSL